MRIGSFLAVCLLAVTVVAGRPAAAETEQWTLVVYMWVDRDNVLSFTDDPRRVPKAYRSAVGRKDVDWKWVTPIEISQATWREALRARLERLRAIASPARRRCGGSR